MKQKIKRATLITLVMVVMMGMQAFPMQGMFSPLGIESVYATNPGVTIELPNRGPAPPGRRNVQYVFTVENKSAGPVSFTNVAAVFPATNSQGLENIRFLPAMSDASPFTVAIGQTETITMQFDVRNNANQGWRDFNLELTLADSAKFQEGPFEMVIMDSDLEIPLPPTPEGERIYRHAADFSHTLGGASGFSHGRANSITFQVMNRSDTAIRNAQMIIELPDGMSVFNASTSSFIGTISIGQRVGRTFSVMVYDDLEGGRAYPITIKLTGTDRGNKPVALENTFYIPVTGTGAGAIRDISIQNISIPAEVGVDEDFIMTFNVRNTGSSEVRNIKAYADMPEGIINKSNATFVIDSIGAGESQTFSITMSAWEGSNRSLPIKIAVEPLSGAAGSEVIQYASVFASGGAGNARTPQLMIDRYSYGGSSVLAGREFQLNLSFVNTSNRRLSNIRATLSSEGGTFVPVDSSNSFFIDSVAAGGHFSRTVTLRASPSAEQKTTAIMVTMTYEDGSGEFTAEDTISIPVFQVMRLSVDEIVPPFEVYAFTPGFSSLQFYNMGHTTLNNLMITAEGDFDVMQSNSYYVGNMEGGTSDTFSFSFIPRDAGPMEGKVVFTYEDLDGQQIIHEVPFTFMVMEMPEWEDRWGGFEEEKQTPWALIIFGIAAVLGASGFVVWRKIRKTRLDKKLEIEDAEFDAAFDLEKTGDSK